MPIYEFICDECAHAFEKRVPSSRSRVACPECESAKVTKQFSRFAFKGEFKFVGSGGGCSRCSSGG
ncbi:MAG: zinc ribbon domain-containing protein [candidate division NC10 bacterium]|nr:zinc ribbon domain-containing protein [candidate division NC10 bacterium]MBI2456676.1 zinc ribbon domain-containing protein [candidate division NC10 bacterium]MBI2561231.1 zinc ribbon domain-containing protein [candidate division NC10 bacterium]